MSEVEQLQLELFKLSKQQEQLYLDFKSLDRERRKITGKITQLKSKVRRLVEPQTKVCRKCEIEMEIDQFYKCERYVDGRESYCRECKSEMNKEYRRKKAA